MKYSKPVTDNTPINEFMDTGKIEEVIGGAKNIQLFKYFMNKNLNIL